jgi:hypothetical protein
VPWYTSGTPGPAICNSFWPSELLRPGASIRATNSSISATTAASPSTCSGQAATAASTSPFASTWLVTSLASFDALPR